MPCAIQTPLASSIPKRLRVFAAGNTSAIGYLEWCNEVCLQMGEEACLSDPGP